MEFAFSPQQRERLFDALGRSDSGAWHLIEDVELALRAYGSAELGPDADPATNMGRIAQTRARIAGLRSELATLPEVMRKFAALEEISAATLADLVHLSRAGEELLDKLEARLAAIAAPAAGRSGPCATAERFVHAVGQAFRNRLNIKPTIDAHGVFRRFFDALLDLVRRRHADLDDLASAMTDERLKRILAID